MAIGDNTPDEQLLRAVKEKDWDTVKTLIQEKRVGLEVVKNFIFEGETLLIKATSDRRSDVVELLIEMGVDIERPDEVFGERPLTRTVENDEKNIAELLLEADVDVNGKTVYDKDTALINAAMNGNERLIERLRKAGADIHAINEYGSNAFMEAIIGGHADSVEQLFRAGATMNNDLTEGQWAGILLQAFTSVEEHPLEDMGNRIDAIQTFMRNNSAKKNPGGAALALAVLNRKSDVVQKLAQLGFDGHSSIVRIVLDVTRDLSGFNEVIKALEKTSQGKGGSCKVAAEDFLWKNGFY